MRDSKEKKETCHAKFDREQHAGGKIQHQTAVKKSSTLGYNDKVEKWLSERYLASAVR